MRLLLSLLMLICLLTTSGHAAPLSQDQVPELLKPWVGWVLHGHEENKCPPAYNADNQHLCLWPSRLNVTLDKQSGHFSQSVQLIIPAWVALPKTADRWPTEVTVDGKPQPVLPLKNSPGV